MNNKKIRTILQNEFCREIETDKIREKIKGQLEFAEKKEDRHFKKIFLYLNFFCNFGFIALVILKKDYDFTFYHHYICWLIVVIDLLFILYCLSHYLKTRKLNMDK